MVPALMCLLLLLLPSSLGLLLAPLRPSFSPLIAGAVCSGRRQNASAPKHN
jgi:hypothetical protein